MKIAAEETRMFNLKLYDCSVLGAEDKSTWTNGIVHGSRTKETLGDHDIEHDIRRKFIALIQDATCVTAPNGVDCLVWIAL